jgi:phospholipase D-like protein
MKIQEANRTYLARDVYPRWKQLVKDAKETVTIYTPFLDRLLLALLSSNSDVETGQITVITDFNPASILEQPHQLRTIKKALSRGFPILSLANLHAKVLLVDDKYIATGSQNFTFHGRKSKECTVVPCESMKGARFVDTLICWREQAEPIDEDLVDSLISKLEHRIRQHKKLLLETQAEFIEICKHHEQEKQNALIRRLEELERQSRIRMSQGVVYASIDYVSSEWGGYESLRADNEYDMTSWIIEKPDGSVEPYRLSRLSMYPMILADSNRMGFARIGKTRISYIRKGLNWTNRNLTVDNLPLKVNITFPESDTRKRNIIVKLSHSHFGSCEFDVLFKGDSSVMVEKRYSKGGAYWENEHDSFVKTLEKGFFASTVHLDEFFQKIFHSFHLFRTW